MMCQLNTAGENELKMRRKKMQMNCNRTITIRNMKIVNVNKENQQVRGADLDF